MNTIGKLSIILISMLMVLTGCNNLFLQNFFSEWDNLDVPNAKEIENMEDTEEILQAAESYTGVTSDEMNTIRTSFENDEGMIDTTEAEATIGALETKRVNAQEILDDPNATAQEKEDAENVLRSVSLAKASIRISIDRNAEETVTNISNVVTNIDTTDPPEDPTDIVTQIAPTEDGTTIASSEYTSSISAITNAATDYTNFVSTFEIDETTGEIPEFDNATTSEKEEMRAAAELAFISMTVETIGKSIEDSNSDGSTDDEIAQIITGEKTIDTDGTDPNAIQLVSSSPLEVVYNDMNQNNTSFDQAVKDNPETEDLYIAMKVSGIDSVFESVSQ